MSSHSVTPTSLKKEVIEHLAFLTEVARVRGKPSRLSEVYEQFCTHYRALGICLLSGEGNREGFFQHLLQAALTRWHYLHSVLFQGGDDHHYRRASFIDPTFDAIVAGQWRLAGELFDSVSHVWMEGEEYEDDFCYAEAIRLIVTEAGAGVDGLLGRWEAILENGVDIRLEVARALLVGDATSFSRSLSNYLEAEQAKARAIADPDTGSLRAEELTFFPGRWVSVEGLALLAIAERNKLDVSDVFISCPPLARVAKFGPFQTQGYPGVSFVKE